MLKTETGEPTLEVLSPSAVLCKHGVLAADGQGRICLCNAEAAKFLRMDARAVLGRPADALPPDVSALFRDTTLTRAGIAGRRIGLPGPDGGSAELDAASTCCIADDGACTGVLVVMSALTAAGELGAWVQRLDRLATVGTLSASMAHEIKNALVAVHTFVQDLAERNRDSELSGLVLRELRRVDEVLTQMLRFAGPARPTFSRLKVHRVLEHSLRLIAPQVRDKGIELRLSFAAGRDEVEGDDYQLEQVFLNILLNGVAAIESAGQLSVSTAVRDSGQMPPPMVAASPEGLLEIRISDTGTGMAPETLERAFEPFFSTKPQGTGLGLAIARRIVEDHRGTITAESELAKGTTFRVTLPLAS